MQKIQQNSFAPIQIPFPTFSSWSLSLSHWNTKKEKKEKNRLEKRAAAKN